MKLLLYIYSKKADNKDCYWFFDLWLLLLPGRTLPWSPSQFTGCLCLLQTWCRLCKYMCTTENKGSVPRFLIYMYKNSICRIIILKLPMYYWNRRKLHVAMSPVSWYSLSFCVNQLCKNCWIKILEVPMYQWIR